MNRQPKGTPNGGEFAEEHHPDGPDLFRRSSDGLDLPDHPSPRPPGWHDLDNPTPAEIDAYRAEVEQQKRSNEEKA